MLVREDDSSQRMVLCADLTADGFSDSTGDARFLDGRNSPMLDRVLDYCQRYQRAQAATNALMSELLEHDLFQASAMTFGGDSVSRVDGFQTISEEKFKALPDSILADFARRGIVGLLAAHRTSLQAFLRTGS